MAMSLVSSRVMHFLKSNPSLSYSLSNMSGSFLSLFSTISSPTQALAEHISVIDLLNTNYKLSKAQSIYISKRVSHARCPEQPLYVLDFLKQVGFTEVQMQSMICSLPHILFSDIDKTLRPKIEYFQKLGFEGSELGKLLSKNSYLLSCSLNKKLVPSVETIRKIINDEKDLIKLLHRYGDWIIPMHRNVLHNAAFFQSCGIVGAQLSMLLKQEPRLFVSRDSFIRNYVSRAVNMGFCINSRKLVHALRVICGLTVVKFNRKLELIQTCGFSKDETMQMFRRIPVLLKTSEKKLMFGIQLFLNTIMLPKSQLVNNPVILMLSMEERVIPRWRVLQLLISKKLLKKNPNLVKVFKLREEKFLENYILMFRDNEEALLETYKGRFLQNASA